MKDLPQFSQQEQLRVTPAQTDFSGVYRSMATTPTVLGNIGSYIAQTSSQQLNTLMGYEKGKDPHGSLLPPMTMGDKAFVDAYNQSAKATLTLQGNQAIKQAQVNLAKQPSLSQEFIGQTVSTLNDTNKQILELAPQAIKQQLEFSLNTAVQNMSANLEIKLANQQRQDEKQKASIYATDSITQIHDIAQKDPDAAQELLKNFIPTLKSYTDSRTMSLLESKTALDSANVAFESGKYIGELKRVTNGYPPTKMGRLVEGGPSQYIAEIENKVAENTSLTPSQQKQVVDNVYAEFTHQRKLNSQYQSDQYATLIGKIDAGDYTGTDLANAERDLTRAQYVNVMHKVIAKQQKQYEESVKQAMINDVFGSPESIRISNDDYHDAVKQRIANEVATGRVDEVNATVNVLNTAGRQDNILTNELSNAVLNGNFSAFNHAEKIIAGTWKNPNGRSKLPISREAEAKIVAYQQRRGAITDDEANNQKVYDDVNKQMQGNVAELETLNAAVKQIVNEKFGSPQNAQRTIRQLTGIKSNELGYYGYAQRFKDTYQANLHAANGNTAVADVMTKNQMQQSYGYSWINGQKTLTYMPIEKKLGMGEEGVPIIHNAMAKQLLAQVQSVNDNPDSFEKYEIVDAPDLDGVLKARDAYHEALVNPPESVKYTMLGSAKYQQQKYLEYQKKLKQFSNAPMPKVLVKRGSEIKSYNLALRSGAPLSISNVDGQQVIGDWSMVLTDDKGQIKSFTLNGEQNGTEPVFRPNPTELSEAYTVLYRDGMPQRGRTLAEIVQDHMDKLKRQAEIEANLKKLEKAYIGPLYGER